MHFIKAFDKTQHAELASFIEAYNLPKLKKISRAFCLFEHTTPCAIARIKPIYAPNSPLAIQLLYGVFVVPSQRGKGHAKTLLTEVLSRYRDAQQEPHPLLVTFAYPDIVPLYEKLGFVTLTPNDLIPLPEVSSSLAAYERQNGALVALKLA